MADKNTQNSAGQDTTDVLKSWLMVVLTLIFVLLYIAALFGWLKMPVDSAMISRLEPIIFVIIGYYFGRLPAQQNEKTLKEEITRQTQKADASQHAKEQAKQERESLEEKIKNTRAALSPSLYKTGSAGLSETSNKVANDNKGEPLNQYVLTALNILDS